MEDLEAYLKEVRLIEDKYFDLISNFNTNFPKCLNLSEEKNNFFEELALGEVYNPQFRFEKKVFNEGKFEELKNFKIDLNDDPKNLKYFYNERLKTKLLEINCHKSWGKTLSTDFVKKYRGEPSYYLLKKAEAFAKSYVGKTVKFRKISQKKVARELCEEVFKLTGNKMNVEFGVLNSKVSISPVTNLIKINSQTQFTNLDLARLKVHEIGVHYIRYFNGKKTGVRIFEIGTSNYIETEEGLAVYMEEISGVSSSATMFVYVGRVIATYYSLRKSFYEVFNILLGFSFLPEVAFTLTFRAKRNLCDTSQKGGFTKDYVYFSGYLKVKKFAKNNDLTELFIGKVKIEDLNKLQWMKN